MTDKRFEVDVDFFPADGDEPAVQLATHDKLGLVVDAHIYETSTARVLGLMQ